MSSHSHSPNSLDQLFAQGAEAYQRGDYPACVTAFEGILAQSPDNPDVINNLALSYHKCQRHENALAILDKHIDKHPTHSNSYLNAGVIAEGIQDLAKAMQYYAAGAKQTQAQPLYEHWAYRAHDLRDVNSLAECLNQWPEPKRSPAFHNYHGLLLELQDKPAQAITHYRMVLDANQGNQDTNHHLGSLLLTQGNLDEAEAAFEPILKADPNHIQTCINLASIYKQRGELERSAKMIKQVLAIAPNHQEASDQWLSTLNYLPSVTWQEADQAHITWGQQAVRNASTQAFKRHSRSVINIGLVSADYHQHPVAHFLLPWLTQPRQRLHITLFSNSHTHDTVTDQLRNVADGWINIAGQNTDQARQIIQDANIDILIDLSGHTAGNRLDVLADRCAPLQGTYLGYPNRTGLPSVDFHIGDTTVFPEPYNQRNSEIPVRLPLLAAYQPRQEMPEVKPAPCMRNGYLTFGSLHNGIRLHDKQLRQWASWIKDIPNAHLKLVRHTLKGVMAQRISETLISAGLPKERFTLCHESISGGEHLAHYHDIDIALDTRPWSGHTTACEALWMGVPTVTLPGEHHCSRLVSSALNAADLSSWVQENESKLKTFLQHWHNKHSELNSVRLNLRNHVGASQLSDGKSFAQHMEEALWALWEASEKQESASSDWESLNAKGNQALADGDIRQAILHFSHACEAAPDIPELAANLGNAFLAAHAYEEAIEAFTRCLSAKPDYAPARQSLGSAYLSVGHYEKALECFKQLQADDPQDWQAYYNEGNVWLASHSPDKAIEAYQTSLTHGATQEHIGNNLGEAHRMKREWPEAITCFTQLINSQPDHEAAFTNRGNCHLAMGNLQKAIKDFKSAAEIKGSPIIPQELMASCYDGTLTKEALTALHCAWGEKIEALVTPFSEFKNRIKPDRRLRIGWLSPDFRQHAVAQFLLPLIKALDPQQVQHYAYAHITHEDAVTENFRQLIPQFNDITHLPDDAVANLIHQDRIDILIDTAGHTAHSRVAVMAFRPAPVQLTYLGYPHPCGLERVTGHLNVGPGDHELTAPGFCFDVAHISEGAPLPAVGSGYVTFGSLHTLARLTDEVLALWVSLLGKIPDSKLLIIRDSLTPDVQDQLKQRWNALGGNIEQLILHQHAPNKDNHLDLYQTIDIHLDTFPWSGHTTACEALSQGVPTLTLRGDSQRQSMVARALEAAGLADWICDTPNEFINKGTSLAQNIEALVSLRAALPQKLSNSRLCDAQNTATLFEHTIRAHWHQWCDNPQ